jgi:hypothetical protein
MTDTSISRYKDDATFIRSNENSREHLASMHLTLAESTIRPHLADEKVIAPAPDFSDDEK